ncbi:HYC_CC_PP family protein [Tenacibaculum xiamenense]|uniref:HYC_CC_PP family protein n=1 Tax=Tenacibaculum xiamenense TaxID=1261553 RepID=UPI0038B64EDC
MKRFLLKIVSSLMALVVLFSTMSFTYDLHFCGDTLVDMALFSKAKSCGMEKAVELKTADNCSVSKKGCCTDKQVFVEGQSELKQSFDNLTFEQQLFVTSYVYAYINLFEVLHNKVIPFKNYSPPNVVKDIQLLDEVFLI